jgi:Flp pilus assembly protein TadD
MFSTFHSGHYQPLSWITFALDYLIWGMEPFGYHLTNLVLHAANAALFYLLALRLLSLASSRPPAAMDLGLRIAAGFAAFFFSIHPLRVESVAWATERRDVLSGLFFLVTILCYLQAVTHSDDRSRQARWRNNALIAYGLSLLSKASGVTLPVALLVLDVYPLRRLGGGPGMWCGPLVRRVWWEKVPFFLFAAGAAVIAPLAQSEAGAVAALRVHGVVARLAQSLYGLAFYLWKTILPTDLSPFYEVPRNLDPFAWPFVLSGAIVVTITIGLLVLRHRSPAGLASWICYVAIVAPVLGFVQSGRQMVADRYSYLSCLPWAILLGGGLYYLWKQNVGERGDRKSFLFTTAAAVILVTLGVLTWRQVEIWHDSDRLWNHVLAITDRSIFRSGTAHHFVARVFAERGDLDRAIEHLRISINIEPTDSATYMDLGAALAKRGQINEAIKNFSDALALNPTLSLAHYNLANALAVQGHFQDAAAHLEEALKLKPNYAEAYATLGKLFAAQGHLDEAIGLFRQALEFRPDLAEGHQFLAMALAEKGSVGEANYHYQEARRIMESQSGGKSVR